MRFGRERRRAREGEESVETFRNGAEKEEQD